MSMKRTNQRHSVSDSGLLPSLHWDGECRRWWHYVDMSSSAGQKTAITEQQARDLIARRIGGLKEDAQVRVRRIARGKLRELRETRKRWRRERGLATTQRVAFAREEGGGPDLVGQYETAMGGISEEIAYLEMALDVMGWV